MGGMGSGPHWHLGAKETTSDTHRLDNRLMTPVTCNPPG